MKLSAKQRELLDGAVLTVVRDALQSLRFSEIDSRTRLKIHDQIGDWSSRWTDGALQRLRKAGLIKTAHHRWSATPRKETP
jgi:hypothetical protein